MEKIIYLKYLEKLPSTMKTALFCKYYIDLLYKKYLVGQEIEGKKCL